MFFFFQAEDGIRDLVRSRGLGDVYKRQFIDWARREAAPAKDEPIRTLRETPTAPRQAERSGGVAGRPIAPQAAPAMPPRPRRADWTAPPPWAPNAGTAAGPGAGAAVGPGAGPG